MATVPRPVVDMRWIPEEDLRDDPYPHRTLEIGIGPLVTVDSAGTPRVLDVAVARVDAVTLVQLMARAKELLEEKAAQVQEQHSDVVAWRRQFEEQAPQTSLLERVLERLQAA